MSKSVRELAEHDTSKLTDNSHPYSVLGLLTAPFLEDRRDHCGWVETASIRRDAFRSSAAYEEPLWQPR